MAYNAQWFLYASHHDEARGLPDSNQAMVEDLVLAGSLRSARCVAAFLAVDRQNFWPAGTGELAYADMPLRNGFLHLSAPHIYAKTLESLMPLRPGMSFLGVGSGTGYFNSIVSEMISVDATNHGIDIWPETVAHAQKCCLRLGKSSIEFTVGNVYQLNVSQTARYDRIYLGACANPKSKYLYRLLEVGGVLVGPFQVGHAQQLRRVTRRSEGQFTVEVLCAVQFASLVEPGVQVRQPRFLPSDLAGLVQTPLGPAAPRGSARAAEVSSHGLGLPGVPLTFSLGERPWTLERSWVYPSSFRRALAVALFCRPREGSAACIPAEIWVRHIFPWCSKGWFEARAPLAAEPGPAFSPPPRACDAAEDESEQSDGEGSSTRAPPSSGTSSAEATPQTGPSSPPALLQADVGSISPDETTNGTIDLGGSPVLVEVFTDGRRHQIGVESDPDDVEPYSRPHMLHWFAYAADTRRQRRRRRSRHEMNVQEQEEEEQQQVLNTELDNDGDEVMVDVAHVAVENEASGSDSEMMHGDEAAEPDFLGIEATEEL